MILVDVLVKTMSSVFPEIKEKKDYVKKIIHAEEESFNATLDRGIELFDEVVNDLKKTNQKLFLAKMFLNYMILWFPC